MLFMTKVQKLLTEELREELKRGIFDHSKYTFKKYEKYHIKKDFLYYNNVKLVPLTPMHLLTLYRVVSGKVLKENINCSTFATVYMVSYMLIFNADKSILLHSIVKDVYSDINHITDIFNIVELTAVMMLIIQTLKDNGFISKFDIIMEI